MTLLRQTLAVLQKELLTEWRQRSRVSGIFFFALALVLMVGFASPTIASLRDQAGGMLWIGLLLASTRSLDQSFAVEMENGALEGMVLWPVDPRAIYYGKALANTLVLFGVALVLTPLLLGIFNAELKGDPLLFVAIVMAGCSALAAPGTLFGQLTVQARGSSVLLPLLLFPLVVPVMMAAAKGTTVLLEGDPMEQGPSWLGLLLAFDAIHWSVSGILFSRIVEDT